MRVRTLLEAPYEAGSLSLVIVVSLLFISSIAAQDTGGPRTMPIMELLRMEVMVESDISHDSGRCSGSNDRDYDIRILFFDVVPAHLRRHLRSKQFSKSRGPFVV